MQTIDLSVLVAELDNWCAEGEIATFWWRDDDAAEPCDQLERLLEAADGRPLALAAVPSITCPTLAERLADESHVVVFQHGWEHQNHAEGGPHSEYPAGRPIDVVADEFLSGRVKLERLFGAQFLAVFTPPWHGLDNGYLPLLQKAGLRGLSSKGRRAGRMVAGLIQNNIHCVPIEWSTRPGFGDPSHYIAQLVDHLEQRRILGDRGEATGILTHHLVQTPDSFAFVRQVLDLIASHPAACLVPPDNLFFADQSGLSRVDLTTVSRLPSSPSTTL